MNKKIYLLLSATIIFFIYSSYRVNNAAKAIYNHKIKVTKAVSDKSVGHSTGKVFVTNVTCGGNLSN